MTKVSAVSVPSIAKQFYFSIENSMGRLQNADEFKIMKGLIVVQVFPGTLLEKKSMRKLLSSFRNYGFPQECRFIN